MRRKGPGLTPAPIRQQGEYEVSMRRGYQLALAVAIFTAVWLQAVHVRLVQEEMAAGGMLPMPAKRGSFYVVHRDAHVAGVAWR